jgi:glycosyltransferase involved in cell wall biosynthesis
MPPLSIHFFVQFVYEQGTYFRFHNLAVGLTKLGHNVTIFGSDINPNSLLREELRDGVKYHIIPVFKGARFFGQLSHPLTTIGRVLNRYPPCDVAHLFQPFTIAACPWLWVASKQSKVMLYDWDDLWTDGFFQGRSSSFREFWERKTVRYLEQLLPQKADHVTTCSRFLADLAYERQAKSVTVIHNGFWPFDISEKSLARNRLGLSPDAQYIGFMGRTCHELPWCFRVFERHLSDYPNIRFAICGFPATQLENLSEAVRKRIDCLGSISPLATRDFAASIDLGLLPLEDNSFNQSRFPIKYAEYMAAGTPILCSDIGDCASVSGELPWVLKAGKTEDDWAIAFRNALQLLATDQLQKVELSKIEQFFGWDILSQSLLETYYSALENKSRECPPKF